MSAHPLSAVSEKEIPVTQCSPYIAQNLQRIALWLAKNKAPATTAAVVSTPIHETGSLQTYQAWEEQIPHHQLAIKIRQPGESTENIIRTSPSGDVWQDSHHDVVQEQAYCRIVGSVVPDDDIPRGQLFGETPQQSFTTLSNWARRQKGATYITEASYEHDNPTSYSAATQFSSCTTTAPDRIEQEFMLEITDSLYRLGGIAVTRTVHINSTLATLFAPESMLPNESYTTTRAAVSLQSDDISAQNLKQELKTSRLAELTEDDITQLSESGQNRFNASDSSA